MAKPLDERHIILRWRNERNELLNVNRKPGDDTNQPVKAALTGNVKALQILADDIYQLGHALKTPKRIIERLRDTNQFQGARHEIAVASIFARCGFVVNFIDDSSKRNPEFIAEKGEERIAVEAKSRHRAGVLHQPGHFDIEADPAPAKIKDLYEQALGQNPGGMSFVVFVDVNLPLHLENRTQTHIFLCVLAYHLPAAIEHRFLQRGVHTSWWTLRQELRTHQVVTVGFADDRRASAAHTKGDSAGANAPRNPRYTWDSNRGH